MLYEIQLAGEPDGAGGGSPPICGVAMWADEMTGRSEV
jgi:hypothetical protein